MSKTLRRILASLIFMFCGFFFLIDPVTDYTYTVFETDLDSVETVTPITPTEENTQNPESSYDFGEIDDDYFALKEINEETIGWLSIPSVCYLPVMYSGDQKYLHTDVYGNYKYSGALFMGRNSQGDFENMALIYGHNMKNGSMFAGLKQYKNKSFFNNNGLIEVFDGNYLYKYKVFTVLNIQDGVEFINQDPFPEEKYEYFKSLYERSLIKGDEPDYEAQMLFLQTCDYLYDNCRLVVGSYLVEQIPYEGSN